MPGLFFVQKQLSNIFSLIIKEKRKGKFDYVEKHESP